MGYIQNFSELMKMSINLPDTKFAKGGSVIKELREKINMSVTDLADLVCDGSYYDILKIEKGYERIAYVSLNRWAHALKVSPGYLGKRLVEHYDPDLFHILYHEGPLKLSALDS